MSFLGELKRRKVFRVAVVYALVTWLLIQIADTTFEKLLLPAWLNTALIVFLLFGFPITLILAWAFEIRPEDAPADGPRDERAPNLPFARGWLRGGYLLLAGGMLALGLWFGRVTTESPKNVTRPADTTRRVVVQTLNETTSLRLPLQLPELADAPASYHFPRLAISPDGKQIAYIGFDRAEVHLYLKRAEEAQARRISGTEGAASPFFSPDGEWVAFYAKERLWRVATDSEQPPLRIGEVPGLVYGASWGEDNNIVFGVGYRSVLHQLPSAGGEVEPLTQLVDRQLSHRLPNVLPGAKAVLYQVFQNGGPVEVWVIDLATNEARHLVAGTNPKYANGKLLFQRSATDGFALWSIDFNLDNLDTIGVETPIVANATDNFAVSQSGSLIYSQNRPTLKTRLRIIGESGESVLTEEIYMSAPRFSPDGSRLAVAIEGNTRTNIWLFGLTDNKGRTQITFDGASGPAWSADGTELAYRKSRTGIVRQTLGSAANVSTWIQFEGPGHPMQWTKEGLLYGQVNPLTQADIYFKPADGERIDIETDDVSSNGGEISPDRHWIAYARTESIRPEIYVKAFPGGGPRKTVSTNGGVNPKWSHDGKTLYFVSYNTLMEATVAYPRDGEIDLGTPSPLHKFEGRANAGFDPFDVSRDGRIAIVDTVYGKMPPLIYISNWQQALLTN